MKASTKTPLKPVWQAKPSVPISKPKRPTMTGIPTPVAPKPISKPTLPAPTRPMPTTPKMPIKQSMIEKEMMAKKGSKPMQKITPITKKPR